jgi:spore coat protein U-like protein
MQATSRKQRSLALLCLLIADPASAATATSTFKVQLTLTSSCVINSTATLNFGSQGVLVANVNGTSALAVQCTNTTSAWALIRLALHSPSAIKAGDFF